MILVIVGTKRVEQSLSKGVEIGSSSHYLFWEDLKATVISASEAGSNRWRDAFGDKVVPASCYQILLSEIVGPINSVCGS